MTRKAMRKWAVFGAVAGAVLAFASCRNDHYSTGRARHANTVQVDQTRADQMQNGTVAPSNDLSQNTNTYDQNTPGTGGAGYGNDVGANTGTLNSNTGSSSSFDQNSSSQTSSSGVTSPDVNQQQTQSQNGYDVGTDTGIGGSGKAGMKKADAGMSMDAGM